MVKIPHGGAKPTSAVAPWPPYWRRPRIRGYAVQIVLALGLLLLASYVVGNIRSNLPRLGINFGWDFLVSPASFELGDNPIGFMAGESVLRAFLAGIANTIKVSLLGIGVSTVLGLIIGFMRLSPNWLMAKVAWLYVETVRNIPLLLQLLFWHTAITSSLPAPREAWSPLPGVFLSNRGFVLPALTWHAGQGLGLEIPLLGAFNFQGGMTVSPEFAAVLLGLVVYHASYISETIRGGILGVRRGQIEAALAIALTRQQMIRYVILPQALRIIVPPLTSTYLSLTKNSSMAVAVGYADVVRVSVVVGSDLGRPIECMLIIVVVYLTLSLLTALFMNWYNRRMAFEER